jgi:predicted Zn-dependent peptidase
MDPRFADTEGAAGLRALKIPFQAVKLDNGLRVLLSPDHHVPVVAINITYGVGWTDDPAGKSSLAHVYEHLMFQGSAHVPRNGHSQHIERVGAQAGAMTMSDATTYFEVVPSNELELALWLESDRMGFLVDGIDLQKLDRVRPVIENERRQRMDNAVGGHVGAFLLAAVFPERNPYHNIDTASGDPSSITVDDVKAFGRMSIGPLSAIFPLPKKCPI